MPELQTFVPVKIGSAEIAALQHVVYNGLAEDDDENLWRNLIALFNRAQAAQESAATREP